LKLITEKIRVNWLNWNFRNKKKKKIKLNSKEILKKLKNSIKNSYQKSKNQLVTSKSKLNLYNLKYKKKFLKINL
jgi:hypothetical protein